MEQKVSRPDRTPDHSKDIRVRNRDVIAQAKSKCPGCWGKGLVVKVDGENRREVLCGCALSRFLAKQKTVMDTTTGALYFVEPLVAVTPLTRAEHKAEQDARAKAKAEADAAVDRLKLNDQGEVTP